MLKMLKYITRNLRTETKDQILADFGDWHTFIQQEDKENELNIHALEEGMDERVRALALIDQRLADLYLRCQFVDHHSYRSY